MDRRQVLQVGAALATLPLAGCGASTPDAAGAAFVDKLPPPEKPASPAPTTSASSEPAAPKPEIKDAAAEPAAKEPAPSPFTRVVGKVGRNHGHVLTVAFADVKAGVEKKYDLTGSSGHPHTVTLSPDDMKSLLSGQIVRTKTTRDREHVHRVLARCAPPVDPPEWIPACTIAFSGKDEHELIIPAADVAAKADKTYDIQGIAGHAHTVTITAAEFDKLVKTGGISVRSTVSATDDAHAHTVVIYNRPPPKA